MFIDPRNIVDKLELKGNETVIDMGCGSGAYSLAIARKLNHGGGTVYCVDIQQDILKTLSHTSYDEKLKNLHFIQADVEQVGGTKIIDGQADLIIFSNIMHSLDKKRDALLEAMRLLKNTGRILIVDWKESFNSMGPRPENIFKMSDCLTLCHDMNLIIEKEIYAGSHHYAFVFKKKA